MNTKGKSNKVKHINLEELKSSGRDEGDSERNGATNVELDRTNIAFFEPSTVVDNHVLDDELKPKYRESKHNLVKYQFAYYRL